MTAKDFLAKYLEYKTSWCFNHSINSKPAKIRLRRINSFLKALGISKENTNPLVKIKYFALGKSKELSRVKKLSGLSNLEFFEQGEFLQDRELENNQEIIERIQNLSKEKFPTIFESKKDTFKSERGKFSISWLFNDLLKFRKEIFQIAKPWSGFDEGFNMGLYFGKVHQEKLKIIIRENTYEIDEILCLIIDPNKKEISEKELIEKFNYESIDLEKIDLEYIMENY